MKATLTVKQFHKNPASFDAGFVIGCPKSATVIYSIRYDTLPTVALFRGVPVPKFIP